MRAQVVASDAGDLNLIHLQRDDLFADAKETAHVKNDRVQFPLIRQGKFADLADLIATACASSMRQPDSDR